MMVTVDIVYALPTRQTLLTLHLPEKTTVEEAIYQSNILTYYPEIDLKHNKVGIFSKVVKLNTLLKNGDRIEIYRDLIADPKTIRRKRAEQGKVPKT